MPVAPEWIAVPPRSDPPLHSLLASAPELRFVGRGDDPAAAHAGGPNPPPSTGSRWEGGLVFQPEGCQMPEVWAPCARTNEIQSITVDAASGTWTADFLGDITGPLAFNITAFALQQALEALPSVGVGNVRVTGGPGNVGGTTPYFVEFVGVFAEQNVAALALASIDLAGPGTVNGATTQAAGELIEKSEFVGPEAVFYDPPLIEIPYTCTTYSRLDFAEYLRRAQKGLDLGKSKALENELWTGARVPTNPSLVGSTPNDDDHILNPGGAAAPVAVAPGLALILLAQALANCSTGSRGMIHATAALAERWMNTTAVASVKPADWCFDDIDVPGCRILVAGGRGDIIVNGAGYPGTGPAGQPPPGPNEVWAYATGMVNVKLGEPQLYPDSMAEALDRATNTVTVRAEVTAAAVWDMCCSFAVLVDLCGVG